MQLCWPVDPVFSTPSVTTSSPSNPEDELFSVATKIPALQYQSRCLFGLSQAASEHDVRDLLQCATALDQELSNWSCTTWTVWPYSVAMNINTPAGSGYTPHELHRYPSNYIGRVWNCFRVSRLIVLSILLRATTWLSTSTKLGDAYERERKELERTSMRLVDDVCASVSFLLGDDLSQITSGAGNTKRPYCPKVKGASQVQTGKFSLIWPLYVACSSPLLSKSQRGWMRMRLQDLAERGEVQATFACLTKSQILLGGSDKVRFDCV